MIILANVLILSKDSISVESELRSKGVPADVIVKTISATGFERLSRFGHTSLRKLLSGAEASLIEAIAPFREEVKAIVVVSQTNDVRIPNGASALQETLSLDRDVFCIELVDGCNGFVKALHLLNRMLDNGQVGLVFGGDFNSHMVSDSPPGTSALFGDGFALTVIRKNEIFDSMVRQDGKRGQAIRYGGPDQHLLMDGFEVFAFATREVPSLVKDFGGLPNHQIDALALHQASRLIVERISSQLGFDVPKFAVFNSSQIGNLGPASIPGWLAMTPEMTQKSKVAAVGYGSGLSWGVAIVYWGAKINEVIYV